MRKFYASLQLLILITFGVSAIFYFNFTVEDAYITFRYSENWINIGSLVFNEGEPINALTSPFHAILSAALFFATGHTVFSYKIIAFNLLLISAFLVWLQFRHHPQAQVLALILVLMPPCVMLWTFGGLETPILLFLSTLTVFLVARTSSFNLASLCAVIFFAGLAFLTRYDSILFFLPIVIHAGLKTRSFKQFVTALLAGSMLPILWFAVSIAYYGDLLPTSFYVKTPSGDLSDLLFNAEYIAFYLLFVGILPVLVLIFALQRSNLKSFVIQFWHLRSMGWLYLGLFLEILYGLTMATHHMMFSFRFFVPYLPSAVIVIVDLFRRVSEANAVDFLSGKSAVWFTSFLVALMLFQLIQNVYSYHYSINGISPIGEYRSLGVRDYKEFMQILNQEAFDIRNHWSQVKGDGSRRPRILTFAAGILPYRFRSSYIYEQLVSYRHCFERHNQGLYADYVHILTPRHGTIDQQLPMPEKYFTLISAYTLYFDGSEQQFLVYYNPQPEAHNLSVGINDFCQQDGNVLRVPAFSR